MWTGTPTLARAKSANVAFGTILNDLRWDGIPMLLETPKKEDLKDDVKNLAAALQPGQRRLPHPAWSGRASVGQTQGKTSPNRTVSTGD